MTISLLALGGLKRAAGWAAKNWKLLAAVAVVATIAGLYADNGRLRERVSDRESDIADLRAAVIDGYLARDRDRRAFWSIEKLVLQQRDAVRALKDAGDAMAAAQAEAEARSDAEIARLTNNLTEAQRRNTELLAENADRPCGELVDLAYRLAAGG